MIKEIIARIALALLVIGIMTPAEDVNFANESQSPAEAKQNSEKIV